MRGRASGTNANSRGDVFGVGAFGYTAQISRKAQRKSRKKKKILGSETESQMRSCCSASDMDYSDDNDDSESEYGTQT